MWLNSGYVTKIQALADSLTSIGETLLEQHLCDIILDGLLEEYNRFVTMMCGKYEDPTLIELEPIMVQEAQLEKFRQELEVTNVTANVANMLPHLRNVHYCAHG